MGLIPTGEAGKLLQWYDSGAGIVLRNRTMDDLLDEISAIGPTANKYYLDVSGAEIAALLTAAVGAGSIGPVDVSAGAVFSLDAASGAGSIADLGVTFGAGVSTSLAAGVGAGSTGGVTVAAGAGASLTAVSGAGAAAALTVSGDTTAPTVDTFTVGTPTGSSVPVTAFTASDATGVTGYLITESSTPPASGAAGWVGSAPSTYTAVGTGSVTLYPWAKDAAGNVSSVFGSPRTVTISGGATFAQEGAWVSAEANGAMSCSVGAGSSGRMLVAFIAKSSTGGAGAEGTVSMGGGWTKVGEQIANGGIAAVWRLTGDDGASKSVTVTPSMTDAPGRVWIVSFTGAASATGSPGAQGSALTVGAAKIGGIASTSLLYMVGFDWSGNGARTLCTGVNASAWVTMTSGASDYAGSDLTRLWIARSTVTPPLASTYVGCTTGTTVAAVEITKA